MPDRDLEETALEPFEQPVKCWPSHLFLKSVAWFYPYVYMFLVPVVAGLIGILLLFINRQTFGESYIFANVYMISMVMLPYSVILIAFKSKWFGQRLPILILTWWLIGYSTNTILGFDLIRAAHLVLARKWSGK